MRKKLRYMALGNRFAYRLWGSVRREKYIGHTNGEATDETLSIFSNKPDEPGFEWQQRGELPEWQFWNPDGISPPVIFRRHIEMPEKIPFHEDYYQKRLRDAHQCLVCLVL